MLKNGISPALALAFLSIQDSFQAPKQYLLLQGAYTSEGWTTTLPAKLKPQATKLLKRSIWKLWPDYT